MSEKFYGWSNYETWSVNLWLSNEEGTYNYWAEQADGAADVYSLSRQLRAEHEDAVPVEINAVGWAADLLGAAIQAVNWEEIARHIIADDLGLADALRQGGAVQEPAPAC